jgi:hypothetical protein
MSRWRNPYIVLLTGYAVGVFIYASGLAAFMVTAFGIWPWQYGWSGTLLIHAVLPCILQALPFAFFAAATLAARCLEHGRVMTILVLCPAIAAVALNTVILTDWFTSEIESAIRVRAFLRDHPGAILDSFDGGPPTTALIALAKSLLASLAVAVVCVVSAIVARLVGWSGGQRDGAPRSA